MLGFSSLASSTIADDGALTTHNLVSTDIVVTPSISSTIVSHIYNLATVQIETDYVRISIPDVIPNIVCASSSVTTSIPTISNPGYIINCVFEYSGITTYNPSITHPIVSHIYNINVNSIVSDNVYVSAVDVVPNVILTSVGFSLGLPSVTTVNSVINIVATANYITIDTPEVSIPYQHIKGPFNPDYTIKRTYVILGESRVVIIPRNIVDPKSIPHSISETRVIQIPGVARDTTYHATPDNRNMRIQ